jgi:hypothetical protein
MNYFLYFVPQTTLAEFQQPEFSVVRQHEEFLWLHDTFEENDDYAGVIVSWAVLNKSSAYFS